MNERSSLELQFDELKAKGVRACMTKCPIEKNKLSQWRSRFSHSLQRCEGHREVQEAVRRHLEGSEAQPVEKLAAFGDGGEVGQPNQRLRRAVDLQRADS